MLWKPLEAGKLDKRLRLKSVGDSSQDSTGESSEDEKLFAEVWASIEDISGAEPFFAQQASPETTHVIEIRYRPGLTPRHVGYFGSGFTRKLEIERILDPLQRHEKLVIFAKEKLIGAA